MSQMKRSKLAATDAAARLRAGESLAAVAADAEISTHTLLDRLSKAGFSGAGDNRSREQASELKTYLSSTLLRWFEPWMSDAECARVDPDLFFPEKGSSVLDAKKICASCPVTALCGEYAARNGERFGVWAGLSERDRRKARKAAA